MDPLKLMQEKNDLLQALIDLVLAISDMANDPNSDVRKTHKYYRHAIKLIEYHLKDASATIQ